MRPRIVSWCAALALAALACGGADDAERAPDVSTTAETRPVALDRLEVGDCLTGLVVGSRERIRLESASLTRCSAAHDLEVYATFEVVIEPRLVTTSTTSGTTSTAAPGYPGQQRVVEAADRGCTERIEALVADPDAFGVLTVWPTPESWDAGDRTVYCAAFARDGEPFVGRTVPIA